MGLNYQLQDFEVVDYRLYELEGIQDLLRGPRPPSLTRNSYIAYIGAAQTFGACCQFPFPLLLSERLCIPSLNLGISGSGPNVFLDKKQNFIQYINNARLTVIQVLSGRSIHNSILVNPLGTSVVRRVNEPDAPLIQADQHYVRLIEEFSQEQVKKIIEETRENWIQAMIEFLENIKTPTILLWFSKRTPEYEVDYSDAYKLLGDFPHLVNREMLNRLIPYVDRFVEATTDRGSPHQLMSRFTGQAISVPRGNKRLSENRYYPSPQMHQDAADLLEPVIRAMLH